MTPYAITTLVVLVGLAVWLMRWDMRTRVRRMDRKVTVADWKADRVMEDVYWHVCRQDAHQLAMTITFVRNLDRTLHLVPDLEVVA